MYGDTDCRLNLPRWIPLITVSNLPFFAYHVDLNTRSSLHGVLSSKSHPLSFMFNDADITLGCSMRSPRHSKKLSQRGFSWDSLKPQLRWPYFSSAYRIPYPSLLTFNVISQHHALVPPSQTRISLRSSAHPIDGHVNGFRRGSVAHRPLRWLQRSAIVGMDFREYTRCSSYRLVSLNNKTTSIDH